MCVGNETRNDSGATLIRFAQLIDDIRIGKSLGCVRPRSGFLHHDGGKAFGEKEKRMQKESKREVWDEEK